MKYNLLNIIIEAKNKDIESINKLLLIFKNIINIIDN